MAKFAEFDGPDVEKEGYTNCEDHPHGPDYPWICIQCFNDLHDMMGWTIADD